MLSPEHTVVGKLLRTHIPYCASVTAGSKRMLMIPYCPDAYHTTMCLHPDTATLRRRHVPGQCGCDAGAAGVC